MFHSVLAVEHTTRYMRYSNTPYVTKLFLNSAFVLALLILAFVKIIYLIIDPGTVVVRESLKTLVSCLMTLLKVPAKHRIFYFFLTETFLPLVVIFINKSYQQFAIKGRVHIILHCYLMD